MSEEKKVAEVVASEEVRSVRIDNCARGEGTSGTAAALRAEDGKLHVGYFTDNEVVVLVFDSDTEICDVDPVSSSIGAMYIGCAYDVGLQLRRYGNEVIYFYDENATCLGCVEDGHIEPLESYMWDLTDECPEEIDERIIKELGL